MIPRLAARGKLVLGTALLFAVVGVLHGAPPLVALAGVILAVVLALYLAFYPTAILLRRKKIELSWWVPAGDQPGGALVADRPFLLHLAFRNHGSRTLRVLATRILAGASLVPEERPSATVRRGQQVEVATPVRPLASGHHVLHGAALTFGDPLGLFDLEGYFPNPIGVKVFPRPTPARARPARGALGALHEHVGLHRVRRRGLAGELRELREHAHGDPFKFIAWKASARRGRLMVRELETELVTTHVLLVDVGAPMRAGAIGRTPLDWAIDLAAALARAAVTGGDRVGLCAYDARVVAELPADAGHHHALALVDRLLEARAAVDEDVTDVTPGELVALVARYLAHQEAIDVRVRAAPALDDPRWSGIQAGPDGQLYDVAAMADLARRLVARAERGDRRRAPRAPIREADPMLEPLRQLCRARGLELPVRATWSLGARSRGLAAAIDRALAGGRPDAVTLIGDVAGLAEDEPVAARALGRLRRGAGVVQALVPAPAAFLPAVSTLAGQRAREIVAADLRLSAEAGRRLLARHGVALRDAGPPAPRPEAGAARRPT